MLAPEGTFSIYERDSPTMHDEKPIAIDRKMILRKLLKNKLAVICGIVSNDRTRTIPTMRSVATMVSAMSAIRRYSIKLTGRWSERAYSLSKAIVTIGRINTGNIIPVSSVIAPIAHRSLRVIVRMFPKRYDERSGMK